MQKTADDLGFAINQTIDKLNEINTNLPSPASDVEIIACVRACDNTIHDLCVAMDVAMAKSKGVYREENPISCIGIVRNFFKRIQQ